MKLNTLRALPILSLLLVLLLAACGGAEEPAPTPEPAADSAEPAAETAPTEEPEEPASAEDLPELRVWADAGRAQAMETFISDFETEFGVDVIVEEFGFGDVRSQLVVAGPAGEAADVVIGAHDWLGELVTNGLLAPVDLGDRSADFLPAAIDAFTYDGELYGLPYSIENVAIFRNVDLVPEAPETWDEVLAISQELTANNGDSIEENQYGFVLHQGDSYHFFPLMTAYGGYVFGQNDDGTYNPTDIGIDSAGSIQGAQLYDQMRGEGLIPPDVDGDTVVEWFENGQAALIITGPWNLNRIRESGVNFTIDSIPAGSQESQPFLGVQGYMINAFSENPLLSQIFVTEFVASQEAMQAIYDADPRPSAHIGVLEATTDEAIASFGAAGQNGLPMPAIPEMGSVWQSWGNAVTLIGQQTEDAESAMTTAGEQIRELLGGAMMGQVNVPGSWQEAAGFGCSWDPTCADTFLTDNGNGSFSGTFDIPAGDYETKVALDGAWTENYGVDGVADGDNITFNVPADGPVTFTWDSETKVLTVDAGQ
ncbi:MAG: extracellular solute-binding protein [Chloroflexota bacterium]